MGWQLGGILTPGLSQSTFFKAPRNASIDRPYGEGERERKPPKGPPVANVSKTVY